MLRFWWLKLHFCFSVSVQCSGVCMFQDLVPFPVWCVGTSVFPCIVLVFSAAMFSVSVAQCSVFRLRFDGCCFDHPVCFVHLNFQRLDVW